MLPSEFDNSDYSSCSYYTAGSINWFPFWQRGMFNFSNCGRKLQTKWQINNRVFRLGMLGKGGCKRKSRIRWHVFYNFMYEILPPFLLNLLDFQIFQFKKVLTSKSNGKCLFGLFLINRPLCACSQYIWRALLRNTLNSKEKDCFLKRKEEHKIWYKETVMLYWSSYT